MIRNRKYLKAGSRKNPTSTLLERIRANAYRPESTLTMYDRVMRRRGRFDKRDFPVTEPRWAETADEQPVLTLSSETIELLALAMEQHTCCHDTNFELRYVYGSGLGTNIVAKCTRCGQRYDITDYGNW